MERIMDLFYRSNLPYPAIIAVLLDISNNSTSNRENSILKDSANFVLFL
jgi:hypothetical protein